ncbi:unnamed protein product [Orchesella dallaii]|uniref:Neurotransmitter-gated ion-channel ligand-binding domain-containing protein n=1 Tax=Orchesella dallaii TaxID=48710 RepID=A0ABP1Q2N9_9HEXA
MNKIFILCTVIVVAAYAAPDSTSDLTDSVTTTAEAATTTSAPLNPTSTEKPALNTSDQDTVEDRTRLAANLFKDYDKNINPDGVKLQFGVVLVDFHVLEEKDAIESRVWLRYIWKDSRLQWNAEEYGGASVLRMDSDMIWKPDITLYNSLDSNMMVCWHSNVLIFPSGEVLWVPPCKLISCCHLTLKKHPYGEQVCRLKFGSWTFDGNVLDLDFYKGKKTMDLSDLSNTSGFEILSNKAEKTDKFYPCCKDPYPDLTFNLTIKRLPGEELFEKL